MLVHVFSYKQTFQSLYIRRVPMRIYYIRFAGRVYRLLQVMQLVLFRRTQYMQVHCVTVVYV